MVESTVMYITVYMHNYYCKQTITPSGINTGLSIAGSSGGGIQYFSTILYVHFRNSREENQPQG